MKSLYQALYRKWRPRTFGEVTGQAHITETLKRQVAGERLSHAYLFTGTRGTGKTTCAKILARAVNCEHPVEGDPCNQCPSCLGIENGSILDVLELDAASNNGVDQVRALRDEAVFTPAAVRKRVYIIDEVHMLSTAAFNALLKILEEPPAHLMFILATTELNKVPATIRSRCQQFAFRRIPPEDIARRLRYVAEQEKIDLAPEGAALLARLADGGLRDALSLLDQCSGVQGTLGERQVLDALGLVGNLETARLMEVIAQRDMDGAMDHMARLYGGGKEVSSILGELAALTRDLLLRKTAPRSGKALMTGGFDESTMRKLLEQFSAPRLAWMLTVLQSAVADLPRSANRRTDAELCLIRLCDERLDDSLQGMNARLDRVEQQLQGGWTPPAPSAEGTARRQTAPAPPAETPSAPTRTETPPAQEHPPAEEAPQAAPPTRPAMEAPPQEVREPVSPGDLWPAMAPGLKGRVPRQVWSFLGNPSMVRGTWEGGALTLWAEDDVVKGVIARPAILETVAEAVRARMGGAARVLVKVGRPPEQGSAPTDKLDELLAMGRRFDNIIIKE